jgi:hypothetical protein
MRDLIDYEPSVVPGGMYEAEVIFELEEKESTFRKGEYFQQLTFALKNSQFGDYSRFVWAFTRRTQRWGDFLLAIGGKQLPSGVIQKPAGSYIGKKVMLEIGKRSSKTDKTKTVNEVLAVFPYSAPKAVETPDRSDGDVPF